MANAVKHQLWRLVKSLTKAEKRNFKLYARRADANSNAKFVQLFDAIDRLGAPDDQLLLQRLPISSSSQLSNLKRHLYGEIMTSLRLLYINKEIDIEIRQQIDYARILYGKGLFLDALRILERIKGRAVEHNQDILHLEILEFQKLIEARHVTRSRQIQNKMDLLLNESAKRSFITLYTSELININIQIHGYYIEHGHSRNDVEQKQVSQFWESIQRPREGRDNVRPTFFEMINRFQANMWFYYIQLDLELAQDAAQSAIGLFRLTKTMILKDPDLYLRCLYYVGVMAYLRSDQSELEQTLEAQLNYLNDQGLISNENTKNIAATYYYLTAFNNHFLREDWQEAHQLAQQLAKDKSTGAIKMELHRWLLFEYKFAAIDFAMGHFSTALDYLNHIIETKANLLREDLLINTRLLHLLCHFELGNLALVDYHLTNFGRLLRRSHETAQTHQLAISGLRKLLRIAPAEHHGVFQQLQLELAQMAVQPFEKKAISYLNLSWWVNQKLG